MKNILCRNFLILMLGITGVALIMPALHNMSAFAEDSDGGSDHGGSADSGDSGDHDANDDNGTSDDGVGDDDDGAKVTNAVGPLFDPSKGTKSAKCGVGVASC